MPVIHWVGQEGGGSVNRQVTFEDLEAYMADHGDARTVADLSDNELVAQVRAYHDLQGSATARTVNRGAPNGDVIISREYKYGAAA